MAEITKLGFQISSSLASGHLLDAQNVQGTYIVVKTIAERNALRVCTSSSDGVVVKGTLVYVADIEKFYIYTGMEWTILEFSSKDDRFVITDPQNGQVLVYSGTSNVWKNVDFNTIDIKGGTVDSNLQNLQTIQIKQGTKLNLETYLVGEAIPKAGEIIYELPSVGHEYGRLKVGDGNKTYQALPYIPDTIDLNTYLQQVIAARDRAIQAADSASASADAAETFATAAEASATRADTIPAKAVNAVNDYVNEKFQYMSLDEYNKLPAITPKSMYFIRVVD